MSNGKNVQQELRDIAKDEGVPMKTKVSLLAAGQADTYEIVHDIKKSLDTFMTDQSERLKVVETQQQTIIKEVDILRKLSNRNDVIGSIAAFAAAILTAIGLRN